MNLRGRVLILGNHKLNLNIRPPMVGSMSVHLWLYIHRSNNIRTWHIIRFRDTYCMLKLIYNKSIIYRRLTKDIRRVGMEFCFAFTICSIVLKEMWFALAR